MERVNQFENMNLVIDRYVGFHKQIERRMDGSAGGVYGALIETVVKDGFYYTGVELGSDRRLRHIVTNNSEETTRYSGYYPIESDYSCAINEIKDLLQQNKKVLFCGTPQQCLILKEHVGNPDNLITIDIIYSGFVNYIDFDKYVDSVENEYGSKMTSIRFFNKEFSYYNSKRILFDNSKTIFTQSEDEFDIVYRNAIKDYDKKTDKASDSLERRVGDISLGAYKMHDNDDGLGYSYISVNTTKGRDVFKKAERRVQIVLTGEHVNLTNVVCGKNDPIAKKEYETRGNRVNRSLKNYILKYQDHLLFKVIFTFVRTTQLRPIPVLKFLWYNFISPRVTTSIKKNGLLYVTPHSKMQLEKGSQIILNGPLIVGLKRVKKSALETRLWMQPHSKLIVTEWASFGYGSNIEVYKNAVMEIGNLFSNAGFTMICGEQIKIGNPVNIAKGCTIRDTNGHIVAVPGYKMNRKVEIGNHVWICSDTVVMPGVKIGDGAIVGACSFICRNVPGFTMVQGTANNVIGNPKYFKM